MKKKLISLLLCLSLLLALPFPGAQAATENGMFINKTATANDDGTYTITLEAYATGEQVTTTVTKDVPTDIILVMDQSGSMTGPIGTISYQQYTGNYTKNRQNYNNRHNGGGANLWHKLEDGSYVSVSVSIHTSVIYNKITEGRNDSSGWGGDYTNYWENSNNLYAYVNGEIKKVIYTRERDSFWENWNCTYALEDGTILNQNSEGASHSPTFQNTDDGYLYLAVEDMANATYTYTYTDAAGDLRTIGTSTGENTNFAPAFYRSLVNANGGEPRLAALKTAATTFANSVAAKAAGEDGDINTTEDNVNHRIAVVGYASRSDSSDPWVNTEVFVGATQYNYSGNARQYYGSAFQNMNSSEGQNNVAASIYALDAKGATYTNYGLEMANGIFDAYPLQDGENRNRVIVLFTDGYPGKNANDFNSTAARDALNQAKTAKDKGVTVYAVGIFPGANATTSGNYNGTNTEAANWFMQQVSSNNGSPRTPSYYLSAADAGSLNNIFQQISNQIQSGGSSATLTSSAVVKDIIAPSFELSKGTAAGDITLKTYKYNGPEGWQENVNNTMGAEAKVRSDEVSVTGFNFSENWCGTETTNGVTNFRGNKLEISFKVKPKPGFLGGNNVPTNTSAGIYENEHAQNPVVGFPVPRVNVPIPEVVVTAQDKNVYLYGTVSEDDYKEGATAYCNGVNLLDTNEYTGENAWKAAYVLIGDLEVTDSTNPLSADGEYTLSITVSPSEEASAESVGASVGNKSGENTAEIKVFKPKLTFQDSEVYYGDDVPEYMAPDEKWVHRSGNPVTETESNPEVMTGTKPTLGIEYAPDSSKIKNNKINTKQDIPVKVTVSMPVGQTTQDITEHTSFDHTSCTPACGWNETELTGDPAFLLHVNTCTLTIQKNGGTEGEPYVFTVYYRDIGSAAGAENVYSAATVVGNNKVEICELPVGIYSITEDTSWSWRYASEQLKPSYSQTYLELNASNPTGTITCTNSKQNDYWLNGYSEVKPNIYRATSNAG